jgi:hypothetical protein
MIQRIRKQVVLFPTRILMAVGASLATDASVVRAADEPATVVTVKTPDEGIQPQAVADAKGVIHLLYFKGKAAGGDLFYVRQEPGQSGFSSPVRVNSQSGSAVAVGTIRGGQITLGRSGRIHVAWNGASGSLPKNPIKGSPMIYTRSNPEGTSFEPQRNLMQKTFYLDGGGSVAADRAGNVYVAWHAPSAESPQGESGRRMWVARSNDDGATFSSEVPASSQETGACGCCGCRAFADSHGSVYMLYRAARQETERGMFLLTSKSPGEPFAGSLLQLWRTQNCPMSSAWLSEAQDGVLAAWETQGQVSFTRIDLKTLKPSKAISPPGKAEGRKHPAVASNAQGDVLLAWDEGTGWERGGSLAWQLFDRSGRPAGPQGRLAGAVPVWGLPAVVSLPDGKFTIFY